MLVNFRFLDHAEHCVTQDHARESTFSSGVSFAAVVWSLHPTLSIPHWKENALCDETK